jgi:putative endonuclease
MPSPTQLRGARLEAAAEAALERAGYRIIERNWRGGGGEIDRVAWDGEVLALIEIRSRASAAFGEPAETVRPPKQGRLIKAAMAYFARFAPADRPMARFDVVSVLAIEGQGEPSISVIKNAFDASRAGCLLI